MLWFVVPSALSLVLYATYRRLISVASASPRKLLREINAECLDPYPTPRTCALLARICSSSGARIRQLCAERRGGFYYYIFHKPRGYVTQRDDESTRKMRLRHHGGRRAKPVYDALPPHCPAVPAVGRLDRDSCGLLLMTDDGVFSRRMHTDNVVKVYDVVVDPHPSDSQILLMREPIEGATRRARHRYLTRPAHVERRGHSTVRVSIDQGKYHHVRQLCARSDLVVVELKRVRFGPLELGSLPSGQARQLSMKELELCRKAAGYDDDAPPAESLPLRGECARHLTLIEVWWILRRRLFSLS